ncbi:MAG: hydantoinase B/oxoprolinase family protein, partial [Myxococcota bacterium]
HGRTGPFGMLGGRDGAMNDIQVCINGHIRRPAYGSKGDGFELGVGDWVQVHTPGGGGYGDPKERPRELVRRDLRCGYFSEASAESDYGDLP